MPKSYKHWMGFDETVEQAIQRAITNIVTIRTWTDHVKVDQGLSGVEGCLLDALRKLKENK